MAVEGSTPALDTPPRIPVRTERLIEEVAAYRRASIREIEKAMSLAARDPEAARIQFEAIYRAEVLPFLESTAADAASARAKHPGAVVFTVARGSQSRLIVKSPETSRQDGLCWLDGALVVSSPAASTPFAPPSQLFGVGAGIVVGSPTREPVESKGPEDAAGPARPLRP